MKRVLLLIANVVAVVVAAEQAGSKDRPATDSFLLVVAVLIGKRMSFSFSFFLWRKTEWTARLVLKNWHIYSTLSASRVFCLLGISIGLALPFFLELARGDIEAERSTSASEPPLYTQTLIDEVEARDFIKVRRGLSPTCVWLSCTQPFTYVWAARTQSYCGFPCFSLVKILPPSVLRK